MDQIVEFFKSILAHRGEIAQIIAAIIALGSIIVRFTPTLKDDNWWLPVVKFIGKYIALNTNAPTAAERKTGI